MALISLAERPVISPSIWFLMPLMSSATAGLCTQLRFSFSCRGQQRVSAILFY